MVHLQRLKTRAIFLGGLFLLLFPWFLGVPGCAEKPEDAFLGVWDVDYDRSMAARPEYLDRLRERGLLEDDAAERTFRSHFRLRLRVGEDFLSLRIPGRKNARVSFYTIRSAGRGRLELELLNLENGRPYGAEVKFLGPNILSYRTPEMEKQGLILVFRRR